MRIPPAIAQQIGQHYAAARVNDAAGRNLGSAAHHANAANVAIGSGDMTAALSDAIKAGQLLSSVAGSTETSLDPRVRSTAEAAAQLAVLAVETLTSTTPAAPVDLLATIAARAGEAAADATHAAAYERFAAEELASQWM